MLRHHFRTSARALPRHMVSVPMTRPTPVRVALPSSSDPEAPAPSLHPMSSRSPSTSNSFKAKLSFMAKFRPPPRAWKRTGAPAYPEWCPLWWGESHMSRPRDRTVRMDSCTNGPWSRRGLAGLDMSSSLTPYTWSQLCGLHLRSITHHSGVLRVLFPDLQTTYEPSFQWQLAVKLNIYFSLHFPFFLNSLCPFPQSSLYGPPSLFRVASTQSIRSV